MKRLLLIPIIAALSGCATHLSQEQCLTINWQNEGFNDGIAGKPPRDLSRAAQDCSQYGIPVKNDRYLTGWLQGAKRYCTPDYNLGYTDGLAGKPENDIFSRMPICAQAGVKLNLGAYNSGRQKGLQSFCTYENGMLFARQGKMLPDVCPPTLRAKFNAGWSTGKEQFCNQPENAFALGKSNQPYPEMCVPALYVAFKSEYDRGQAIGQRQGSVQSRINELNDRISSKVFRYSLESTHAGYYKLGRNKSPEAAQALDHVNAMVREKQHLESELFKLQVMR